MPTPPAAGGSPRPTEPILLGMYRNIYATRQFELKCIELYRQGLIRGYLHPYIGQEAVAAGACAALNAADYIVSTHRGHGHCISKGADLKLMMAEIMGKATGYCHGHGGSMHISDKRVNNLGANGIVGAGIPIATGAGMGIRVRGTDQVVVVFFSDGASNNGVFAESLNLAGIYGLPVIYHGCGNVKRIFEDYIEVGVDAYNPLEAKAGLDVVELRRQYGHRIGFCGNMDAMTWATGDHDLIKHEALTKLNAAKGGGFIFQSDHSVPSNVSGPDYEYVVNLIREWGVYPLRLEEYDLPDLG